MYKNLSMYLSGVAAMASSVSDKIGCSYAIINCYDKKSYLDDFTKDYKVSKEIIDLIKYEKSFKELLCEIFGEDKKLIDGLEYNIIREIKDVKNIYTVPNRKLLDKLGWSEKGKAEFYIVDDIYFIECKDSYLVLIIGNNE